MSSGNGRADPAAAAVRPAQATDLPRLVALEAAAFAAPWSEPQLRGALAASGAMSWVAIDGADCAPLAAYALFQAVADEAELLRVATRPEARRRGLGAALVRAGLARLAASGVRRCHLEVRAGNAPALALYRGCGFAAVGRRRRYYGDEDALLLACELP